MTAVRHGISTPADRSLVIELMDDPLIGLFAAWRAEIDSVPFAHESECDEIVRTLLGSCSQRLRSVADLRAAHEH